MALGAGWGNGTPKQPEKLALQAQNHSPVASAERVTLSVHGYDVSGGGGAMAMIVKRLGCGAQPRR